MIRRPPRSTLSLHDALPISTGAILPSSRFLARALVSQLRGPRAPARILEVGPGTGSVTRAIARCLGPDHPLDTVRSEKHTSELQSHFNLVCRLLPVKKKNNM